MKAAKSAGTSPRWRATWRICRLPSHRRHATAASTKAARTVAKVVWVTGLLRWGAMPKDTTPLVWVDMEMSGLVPDRDRILEVALVVTDADLNTIAEAP